MEPSVLGSPDATRTAASGTSPSLAFGAYRLLQKLGEGGMGEVWLAEQTTPVHRQVALKVIKAGMDTAHVVARFEAERQALAMMDHPAIATVFDGGTTPEGRPYFAMEYVKGEPITTYCDRQRLTTTQRLELFIQVCEGVQHAHQKGVIHRDLKPSNVLVTIQGDRPVPKIIDFGIAKATAQHLTERTLFTELGILIGTPEYMSPEQAEMGALDIDTRTDVYALGVILYEVLTGALPFDRKELRQAGLAEIQRMIREKEPPRPSTRVTQIGTASTEAAKNRQTEVKRLAGQLRGDLDWITMKALEKDRTRRYDTVNGLAQDVRRHLKNEPVMAGPPSAAYRTKKFVRRHRFGVGAAATLVLLVIAFAVAMTVQAQRIARERDRANQESAAAKQVADFLVALFNVSDPSEARGTAVTAREILDRGALKIEQELRSQPQIQARLLDTLGRVYYNLGLYDEAVRLSERWLSVSRSLSGSNHADTYAALGALCMSLIRQQKLAAAEPLCRESAEGLRRLRGQDDEATLKATARLASLLFYQGRFTEAEPQFQEALEGVRRTLGGGHASTGVALNNLAGVLHVQGKFTQAESLYREALELSRRTRGVDHPGTLTAVTNLAEVLRDLGRLAEAEAYYRQALEGRRRVLPSEHPSTAYTLTGLADTLNRQKRFAEAEPLAREAIRSLQKSLPPGHQQTSAAMLALGESLGGQGQYDVAETLLLNGYSGLGRAPEYQRQIACQVVGHFYEAWGKPEQAAEWRKKMPPKGDKE